MDRKQIERDIEAISKALGIAEKYEYNSTSDYLRVLLGNLKRGLQATEPREISIWDVIEECKGVTDRDELNRILNKYEMYLVDEWVTLSNRGWYLDQPIDCVQRGYQLRLKEQ